MVFRFEKTDYKSSLFLLTLNSKVHYRLQLIVVGYDPEFIDRCFFRREIFLDPHSKNEKYYLTAPVTSNKVDVMVYEYNERNVAKSEQFTANVIRYDMNSNSYKVDALTDKFVKFTLPFCYNYNKLDNGVYFDKTKQFVIVNLPYIANDNGAELPTPSRISTKDNHIEISNKMFWHIPIPRQMMILLHEYSHNFLNEDKNNESEADLNGLRIYLDLKFPAIESVYAFTQILGETRESHERLDNLLNFIDKYQKTNKYKNSDDSKQIYMDVFASHNIGRM